MNLFHGLPLSLLIMPTFALYLIVMIFVVSRRSRLKEKTLRTQYMKMESRRKLPSLHESHKDAA